MQVVNLLIILVSATFFNMVCTLAEESSWRTPSFRQAVVAKLDEAIRQTGLNITKNSIEMENHIFRNAKNREEYLGFTARFILHIREISKICGEMNELGATQSGPGMPDPH